MLWLKILRLKAKGNSFVSGLLLIGTPDSLNAEDSARTSPIFTQAINFT